MLPPAQPYVPPAPDAAPVLTPGPMLPGPMPLTQAPPRRAVPVARPAPRDGLFQRVASFFEE